MGDNAQTPVTAHIRFEEHSPFARWRGDNRFSIVRAESDYALDQPVHKSSEVPALLISVSMREIPTDNYRLLVDGKVVPTPRVQSFRSNVIDLAAEPGSWASCAFDYMHFHLPRSTIEKAAEELGHRRVGEFRLAVVENDLVLAQLARAVLPTFRHPIGADTLILDHVEQILAAHILQRYTTVKIRRPVLGSGLAGWQRRRAMEYLAANVDGRIRIADLARECRLSESRFFRAFKASFGMTTHDWLTNRRVELAKELLATDMPLADVAVRSGFSDQAALTRTFSRLVGVPPGRWRHEHRPGR